MISLLNDAWSKYDGTDASLKAVVTEVLAYDKNWKFDLNTVAGLNDAVTAHLTNIINKGMQSALESLV